MKSISSGSRKAWNASAVIKSYSATYCLEVNKVRSELNMFNMISSYYNAYSFDEHYSGNTLSDISNCTAIRLVKNIISLLSTSWDIEKGSILPKKFYKQITACEKTNPFLFNAEKETIEYYYRKTANIMKAAGMIKHLKGKIFVDVPSESDVDIYFTLLKTFWYSTEWEQIFPSDIDMANSLHYNKCIFKDILLKEKSMYVQDIADQFCDLTGISVKGDFSFISFLDFYLLKWLEHFNLVKYRKGSDEMPVSFEISRFTSEAFAIIS